MAASSPMRLRRLLRCLDSSRRMRAEQKSAASGLVN